MDDRLVWLIFPLTKMAVISVTDDNFQELISKKTAEISRNVLFHIIKCRLIDEESVISGLDNVDSQTSNISRSLVGNTTVNHSDVLGAPPVGVAPSTSSLSKWHWIQ